MSDSLVDVLVANHRQFLAFLERRTASREDAEDILQDAFLRSMQKASEVRDEESVVAWFYRVLRNALVDYYRRRDAGERALEAIQHESTEQRDEELWNEACRCVGDLLPNLKTEYAELLRRVDLEDSPVSRAAVDLGISPNNASVRLYRARKALLEEVRQSCRTCADHGCLDCTCRRAV